ncbi:hypothetical protein BCR34DRAFT_636720 [Clohesyomyces aquaticus]|uniref:Uncharacterized protein n=1 Tax=Clohesyomyces aquaticus TaxID=1231657 RepID=A0A1Y1YUK4_9PLEO|nr:hypothetical protein BCR34DRAFT_636720 [Clohesyomyces aquaticus]
MTRRIRPRGRIDTMRICIHHRRQLSYVALGSSLRVVPAANVAALCVVASYLQREAVLARLGERHRQAAAALGDVEGRAERHVRPSFSTSSVGLLRRWGVASQMESSLFRSHETLGWLSHIRSLELLEVDGRGRVWPTPQPSPRPIGAFSIAQARSLITTVAQPYRFAFVWGGFAESTVLEIRRQRACSSFYF